MNNSAKKTLIFTVVIILVAIGLFTLGKSGNSITDQEAIVSEISMNGSAPNFNLKGLDGETYTLEQFKGQNPVLLEFFAVWCPHCQNQAKVTSQIAKDNQENGLITLSINSSPFGRFYTLGNNTAVTENDLKWYRDQFKVEEPILVDDGSVGLTYGLKEYPMFVLIDKNGKIVWSTSGETGAGTLQAEIDKVL